MNTDNVSSSVPQPHGALRRLLQTEVFPGARSRRWKGVIAAGALPAPLAAICETVVAGTRLHSSEKADVARELVAHFRDGLDSGKAADELARDFGDARTAALLIRRGMKRRRSLAWHFCARSCEAVAVVAGLAVCATAFFCGRTWLSHPTITRNFYSEYDARFSRIADADRAWPLYLEAFKLAPAASEAIGKSPFPSLAKGHAAWDDAVAHNAAMQPALAAVRRAAARPTFDAPLSTGAAPELIDYQIRGSKYPVTTSADPAATNEPLFAALLPHLGAMRRFARELKFDALLAMDSGDAARVEADLGAMLGMANHLDQQRILIPSLVSQAMFSLYLDLVREAVVNYPGLLSDARLVAIAHSAASYPNGSGTPRAHLDGERAFLDDVLQRAYTDNGSGDGHPTREGARLAWQLQDGPSAAGHKAEDYMLLAANSFMASRRDTREVAIRQFDRADRIMALPLWERDESADREIEHFSEDPILRLRYFLVSSFLPALDRVGVTTQLTILNRDGALVGIALELYKRRNGVYPESLAALVPSFIPAVPADRFDGMPLRYKLVDGKPLIYSIASDYEDNGGTYSPETANAPGRWIPRAKFDSMSPQARRDAKAAHGLDWLLWPATRERIGLASPDLEPPLNSGPALN